MGIITEEIDLPTASPKSFHPAAVTPTHDVHFHDELSPASKLRKSKSSGLALSLRRVTPDRFKHDERDGSSFVSRLTGKGSIYTGATPVMRGAGGNTNTRSKSPGGIERQQKMEDEYYIPPKDEEEELDDGELPSLSRTPSNASGGRTPNRTSASPSPSPRPRTSAYWNQDEDEDSVDRGPSRYNEAAVLAAAAAAKTAAEKASPPRMNTTPKNKGELETLKVAGFWSQLDEVSTDSNSYEDKEGRLRTVHHNGYEEEPDDERQWRRSQSPAKSRGCASHGPNYHRSESVDSEPGDSQTKDSQTRETQSMVDSRTTKQQPPTNWNLLEKAACFAQDNAEEEDMHTVDQSVDNASVDNASVDNASVDNASVSASHQSLDHTYQTSTSNTNTAGATLEYTRDSNTATTMNENTKNEEEKGMFSCLTDALGAICGFSTYVSDPAVGTDAAPSSAEKKEKALSIIERDRQRREKEGFSYDEETDAASNDARSKNHNGIGSFESEYYEDEEEREDAAIELEYLSRDGPPEEAVEDAQQMSAENPMASNTVVAGVAAVGAAGLVVAAATSNAAYEEPPEPESPTEPPMSPTTEKKKKRLTVKSVQNLLGLRKKKEAVNEETRTLANVMASSTKAQAEPEEASNPQESSGGVSRDALLAAGVAAAGVVGAVAATGNDEDDVDMPEMTDADDDDSVFTENDEEMEEQDADETTIREESTIGGLNSYKSYQNPKTRSIFDEEELESQASRWDSNRKNSYLRELAQRAKQEYAQKKSTDHPDPDLTTAATASMSAAAMAAVMASRGSEHDERSTTSSRASRDIEQSETGATAESKSSYNVDYSSFSPLEKRKFLRLLNSGISPQEATRSIVDEREEIPALEDADETGDVDDADDAEDVEDDMPEMVDDEESAQSEYEEEYDVEDEGDNDPPGDSLGGESGESAELSVKEDVDEDRPQGVSRSELATAGGNTHDSHLLAAGAASVTAVMAVPAIVRAKSKSRQSPGQQYTDEDMNGEQQQYEPYQRGADGLISVGDSYYDSLQRSYEQDDVDNTFLLSSEKNSTRVKKKVSKGLSVSTSFAKVAARRSLESPRTSTGRFTSVDGGSAAHNHFSRPNSGAISLQDDDDSVDGVTSPRSEASSSSRPSKFNFLHRSTRSKWSKLGSNLDSDVQESRTIEHEEKDFYSPMSAPVQAEDAYSPRSAPPTSDPDEAEQFVYSPTSVPDEEEEELEEENYLPRSLHVQAQEAKSPFSYPGDEMTPVSASVYEISPASTTPVYESRAVQPPPSTEASHVALPSLLPELPTDARERNVVTPTYEMEENKGELFSPVQSAFETESRANSMFLSPDSLSPTSPQDLGSPEETSTEEQMQHDNEESYNMDRESHFRPIVSPAAGDANSSSNSSIARSTNYSVAQSQVSEPQKPPTPTNAGTSPANQMPLIPNSPNNDDSSRNGSASPDHTDAHSMTNYSLAEQSYLTLGTAWTTASKSSRRRHKGAAGKRLMQAKEAGSHAGAKSKGWMGSIRDVAAKRDQAWDPEKGWQGYTEPETTSNFHETKPIGSLHLAKKIPPRKLEPVVQPREISRDTGSAKHVDFPQEWANERKNMIETVQPQAFAAVGNSSNFDSPSNINETSVFASDASTVNTSADTTTLLQNAHAPIRRTKPKPRVKTDKRKGGYVPSKTVGWKESMEAATAHMQDEHRHWNYDEGWVDSLCEFPDDVSELTKTTLERSPGNDAARSHHSSPVESISPASPMHSPAQFLPSVAEEVAEAESSSQAEDEEAEIGNQTVRVGQDVVVVAAAAAGGEYKDRENGSESPNSDFEEIDGYEDHMNEDAPVEDSDKENELSVDPSEDTEDASPKLATEEFPLTVAKQAESENLQKPPMPKRSLNQWLERSQKDGAKSPDVDSAHAVNSQGTTVDNASRPKSLYSDLDDVKVDETEAQEIHVVRERCDKEDRNLFENDVSDIQLDSSNSRDNLVMESFETANSSESEWLASLSPKEKDLNETDDTSVSSRALAWMSQMEKNANTTSRYSQNRAVTVKADPPRASDPPQNLDPPSIANGKAAKRIIASRYSSSSLSNQTLAVSTQHSAPKKSRVEELISKLEKPDKATQSSHVVEEKEEHSVIFHSNAMGIRLKRGEDGLVRVVSVTESSPGSSIVRDGKIEPDDIIREAAGADLRSPISNSQWGEVVLQIRNASRPMKFVIISARKRSQNDATRLSTSQPQHNSSRSLNVSHRTQQTSNLQQKPPKILFGGDDSVASSVDHDSMAKQSLFNRISDCAAPTSKEKAEGGEVPMAHLAFLRTNPTIARVRNEASRRYPALCGRPDTIFEEPEDAEAQGRTLGHSLDRSADTSFDASVAPTSASGAARTYVSSGSSASGDNVAYLEGLAAKSAVSNKSYRSWNNNSQKLGQKSMGRSSPTGSDEVRWPDSDGEIYAREPDTLSVYSARSQSAFHLQKNKRDTARKAELLAESKVVAMMEHELQYFDSAEECEI